MAKGQSINSALKDVLGDNKIETGNVGVHELSTPKEEMPDSNDIGVGEQDGRVSLDFTPGQPKDGTVRRYAPTKKEIVGRRTPGEYEREELIQSQGDMYCSYDLTYNDTEVHDENFVDEASKKRFISSAVILEADSDNTSDVQYKFNPTGSYKNLSAGKQLTLDGKKASKIWVKLGTSADILYVVAW